MIGEPEWTKRPGRGSSNLSLPPGNWDAEKTAQAAAKTAQATVQGNKTILIIDDEEVIIDITREILGILGYQVLASQSGQEGIDLYIARQKEIDLVILDMIMPRMGGGETFNWLKSIDPQVRVLLSTGDSLSGQVKEMMDKGCLGFIQKPFRIEALSQKIKEVLEASA